MKDPFAKIGDKVYHITPESPKGIVIDISYSFLTKLFQYQVSFSIESEPKWYYEHDLSLNMVF